jgi:hypothetical protein
MIRAKEKEKEKHPKIDVESEESMRNMIQKLFKKVEKLSAEVEYLKQNQNIKRRKRISEILNERNCTVEWKDWIKKITISEEDLEKVLKGNIIIGIKYVLENIISIRPIQEIPVAAFIQKENNIYIYSSGKWQLAKKQDIEYVVNTLRNAFYMTFTEWSKTHIFGEFEKPAHEYSAVVYGSNIPNEKKMSEIKKMLFNKIKTNLEKDALDDSTDM